MASREDAIDQFLGAAPSSPALPSRPDVGKRKPMSKDQAIDAFLGQQDLPPGPPKPGLKDYVGQFFRPLTRAGEAGGKEMLEGLKTLQPFGRGTEGPLEALGRMVSGGGKLLNAPVAAAGEMLASPALETQAGQYRPPVGTQGHALPSVADVLRSLGQAGATTFMGAPTEIMKAVGVPIKPRPRPTPYTQEELNMWPSGQSPILRQQLALPPATRGVHVPSDVVEGQLLGVRDYPEVPPKRLIGQPPPSGELPPHVDWRTPPPPPKMLTAGLPRRRRGAIISGPGEPPPRPELPPEFQDVVPGARMPDRIEAADLARMHRELVEELGVGKGGAKIAPESPTAPPSAQSPLLKQLADKKSPTIERPVPEGTPEGWKIVSSFPGYGKKSRTHEGEVFSVLDPTGKVRGNSYIEQRARDMLVTLTRGLKDRQSFGGRKDPLERKSMGELTREKVEPPPLPSEASPVLQKGKGAKPTPEMPESGYSPPPKESGFEAGERVVYQGKSRWISGTQPKDIKPGHIEVYDPSVPMGHLTTREIVPIADLGPDPRLASFPLGNGETAKDLLKWTNQFEQIAMASSTAKRFESAAQKLPKFNRVMNAHGVDPEKFWELAREGNGLQRQREELRALIEGVGKPKKPLPSEASPVLQKAQKVPEWAEPWQGKLVTVTDGSDRGTVGTVERVFPHPTRGKDIPVLEIRTHQGGIVKIPSNMVTQGKAATPPRVTPQVPPPKLSAYERMLQENRKPSGGGEELVRNKQIEASKRREAEYQAKGDETHAQQERTFQQTLAAPRFEATPEGQQGLIGGTPERTIPTSGLKAKAPQSLLSESPLFGGAKREPTQVGLEALDPQRAAVQEWLTDQLGSQAALALSEAKSAATIPPAVQRKLADLGISPQDAFDVTKSAVPKADTMERLVAKSLGQEPKALPAARPAPFQRKGDYEHGQPSLADPDDAISVIQGYGKIKPSEDWRGEIARLPAWMKSKNGKTLEEMAEALEDTYGAALGTRQEIKQKLFDTLDSYSTLKANKKTRAAEAAAAEGEAAKAPPDPLTTEIRTDVPPSDVTVNPADWKAMGPIERRSAIEFFRDALTDESGRLDLKAMAKALKRFRGQFPKETAVIKERPNSPVIAEVERWNTGLSDGLQMIADYAWWKRIRKMDPEALKDLEQRMVQTWDQGGKTQQSYNQAVAMAPPEVQAAMRHRARALQLENQSRRFFGLQDIPEQPGPYIPRKVDPESREAVSIGAGSLGRGAGPQTTVRGHGQERTFETFRQGERQGGGLEYEDPRNSILYREWEGIKLRATHRLFKNLEAKGTLFRDKNAAAAVAPNGRPWRVENAPGGEWWTPTEAEAKFLRQNLIESNRGPMTSLVGYANTLLRNPNLVNPAPHVVKNMAMKELLAQGPVSMSTVARDAVEYFRGTNPQLLREFHEAMPFSESARAAGEILGRELRSGPMTDAVRTAMSQLQHLNRPSQKVIFEWADPAMRYSLYKHYRGKGKDVYEAGNHAWVDLIRYGTRSERTDFWKAMPLNFFVPWRYGTFVSLMKQAKNHPVRTAALIAGVDYLREVRYRQSGRWTHLPWDYVFNPIAHLAQAKSAKEFATTLGSEATLTALFGPGGAFAASQMVDMLNDARGRGDYRRLANMFWGVGQLYGVAFEDIPQGQWGNALGGLLLGEHKALSYQPRRLGPGFGLIPESVLKDLPGMQKSRLVREAEEMQQEREERIQKRQERQKDRPTPGIEERLKQSGYRF